MQRITVRSSHHFFYIVIAKKFVRVFKISVLTYYIENQTIINSNKVNIEYADLLTLFIASNQLHIRWTLETRFCMCSLHFIISFLLIICKIYVDAMVTVFLRCLSEMQWSLLILLKIFVVVRLTQKLLYIIRRLYFGVKSVIMICIEEFDQCLIIFILVIILVELVSLQWLFFSCCMCANFYLHFL